MGEDKDGGSTMALKFLYPEVTHLTATHGPLMETNFKGGRERKQQSWWNTHSTVIFSTTGTKSVRGRLQVLYIAFFIV